MKRNLYLAHRHREDIRAPLRSEDLLQYHRRRHPRRAAANGQSRVQLPVLLIEKLAAPIFLLAVTAPGSSIEKRSLLQGEEPSYPSLRGLLELQYLLPQAF